MRNAFMSELVALAAINKNIVLMVGDLGYSVVEPFRDQFPDRFINAGVAEQNMMGMAAGLASEGCHVFVYSIANFPTFRCAEQIRNDVDYHQLPVTVVSVGGGLAYGNLGYSHHAVQDYALMRVMPNMLIGAPGDPLEVSSCLRYLVNNPQPSYLRLGKAGEKSVNLGHQLLELAPGMWNKISLARDTQASKAILSTGNGLQIVSDFLPQLETLGFDVYSMPLWGMKNKLLQPMQVQPYESLYLVEDHLLDGGFSSWMLEALLSSPALLGRIKAKTLSTEVCGLVASQHELHKLSGMDQLLNFFVNE